MTATGVVDGSPAAAAAATAGQSMHQIASTRAVTSAGLEDGASPGPDGQLHRD